MKIAVDRDARHGIVTLAESAEGPDMGTLEQKQRMEL